MARRRRRPWYRTRAYRLTRTVAVTAALVTGGVWWAQGEEPGTAVEAAAPGSRPDGAHAAPGDGTGDRTDGRSEPRGTGPTAPRAQASPSRPPADTARPTPAPSRPPAPAGTTTPARPPASPTATAAPRSPSPARPQSPAPDRRRSPQTASSPAASPKAAASPTPAGRGRPGAVPPGKAADARPARAVRVVIPYIDVDAPVTGLRLDREGRLPAPRDDDTNLVGWYEDGPRPGERGTAVAVGHLDTRKGPAVFAGLSELRPGRLIEVRRADGRTAVYAVDALKSYEKDRFPSKEVYGDRGRAELRLITCDGAYDRRTGYSGNLVVFAHLKEAR